MKCCVLCCDVLSDNLVFDIWKMRNMFHLSHFCYCFNIKEVCCNVVRGETRLNNTNTGAPLKNYLNNDKNVQVCE